MKRTYSLLFAAVLMVFFSCSPSGRDTEVESAKSIQADSIKKEIRDGVPHIFNPSLPLKGEVTLELEKYLEIDSQSTGSDEPVVFRMAAVSDSGDIFIWSSHSVEIFAFNPEGKLKHRFLSKGEGPGEHKYGRFSIQPLGDSVWVPGPGKIIRFSTKGDVMEEIKLQKKILNIEMVDNDRFVGNHIYYDEKETDELKRQKCICALRDRSGKSLVPYLEAFGAEETQLRTKNLRLSFSITAVTPRILHLVDSQRKTVTVCFSSQYSFIQKTISGRTIMVFHKEHRNVKLSDSDRTEIVDTSFIREPPHIKKLIRENLPAELCSVSGIQEVGNGFLAVSRITGLHTTEFDVFDTEGRYLYILKLPEDMKDMELRFHGNSLYGVKTSDDESTFEMYRVINFSEIFEKKV